MSESKTDRRTDGGDSGQGLCAAPLHHPGKAVLGGALAIAVTQFSSMWPKRTGLLHT